MKELTIEEKAKAYDSIFERLKKMYNNNKTNIVHRLIYERYFPELAESEDEKIRKELIEFFNQFENGKLRGVDITPWIAWLEKQGHDGKKWIYEDAYLKEKEQVFQDGIDEVLENPQKYGLEKQDEQKKKHQKSTDNIIEEEKPLLEKFKQAVYDCAWEKVTCKKEGETKEEYAERWAEHFLLMVRDWADDYIDFTIQQKLRKCFEKGKTKTDIIEKQDEQNPSDEVKPKFKVGDWVVNKQNEIARINQIFEDTHGTQRYHIGFTDGTKTYPRPCDADDDYRLWTIQDAKEGDVLANNGNIILFKEISNSARQDYKYIKSHCFVLAHSLDFYTGGSYNLDDGFHPTTQEQHNLLFSKMKESGYEWDVKDKVLKKIEQKPDWNEEDDRHLSIAIQYVFEHGYLSTLNWLKSIKDRVIPQTKQEWSEESEIMLDRLIKHFNKNDFDRGYEVGVSAAKFNQWKPTEEQMSYFASAIERFDFCDPEHAALEAIYTHFKNLQNQ